MGSDSFVPGTVYLVPQPEISMQLTHVVGGRRRVNSVAFVTMLMRLPTHRRASFTARLMRRLAALGITY